MAKEKEEKTQTKPKTKNNEKKDNSKKSKNTKTTVKKNETAKKETSKNTKPSKKVSKEALEAEKQIEGKTTNNSEFAKLIKIVLIVTAVMLVFYLITLVATSKADKVNTEESTKTDEKTKTEIQYNYIMIGEMLNYGGTYYVLIEEDEDNRINEYSTLMETISANEDAPKVYTANLTDAFNKGYLSKEANYDVEDIADFRVTGTTLVKIVDNKISDTYETYDAIKSKLKELSE